MAVAGVEICQAPYLMPWLQGPAVAGIGGIWTPAVAGEGRLSLAD